MSESIQEALESWRELYGGELEVLPAPAPDVEAVAARHPDYRSDPGNWPKIFHHRRRTERVAVLIHGLKDAPAYMEDVGRRFAAHGANVVLPLLPGHGRRDPVTAMRRVDYRQWRSAVDRALDVAALLGDEISIGGFSTGGALAIDACIRRPSAIAGKVFLFSAALGMNRHQRWVLAPPLLPQLADAWKGWRGDDGIGGNPTKYTWRFLAAARQVHLLIEDLRHRAGTDLAGLEHRGRIFVAHSEVDTTIPISAVRPLVAAADAGQHHLIPEALGVGHTELVLAEAMSYRKRRPDEADPQRANPEFEKMIEKALAFWDR